MSLRSLVLCVGVGLGLSAPPASAAPSFIEFESGPVRPLALSPDGSRLVATNTPDNRLEIFNVTADGLQGTGAVSVGLEPVAVAFRNANEVWVVNHLSDSVSIVRLDGAAPRVIRTLLLGDEPRDIVFAGTNGRVRAFVTTAHRGQRRRDPALAAVPGAGDPYLTSPRVGRADVWVFDAAKLGDRVGGTPLKIVTLFGDTPRALAVSADRTTVYAAVFASGNQTTTVSAGVVCPGFGTKPCTVGGVNYPGGHLRPATNAAGAKAPQVGLIVKYNQTSGHFVDELARNWDAGVHFSLPDKDVFAINALSLAEKKAYRHVGTTLFNMAVHPLSGKLFVSNTEANNLQRFEGPGVFGGSTVQGHLAQSRVSIIEPVAGGVTVRRLNKHIDYAVLPAPIGTADHSLATPMSLCFSADGAKLYVAAFGSSKVGVFDTAALEADSFDPTTASANYITVSGGGPAGLVLDEARQRLYVLTRFDNAVSVVNVTSGTETAHLPMFNPEPASIVNGRPVLYDARLTSSNGEAACASCHMFGDMDHLAWDLGNPDDEVTNNSLPIKLGLAVAASPFRLNINGTGDLRSFHPMKGPMTTQTLRGMANHGAMHWRGDRTNGSFGVDTRTQPPFNSRLSLRNFIGAFEGLLGRAERLSNADMNRFADFALALTMPPNPIRNLDNSLTAAQARGRKFYFGCDAKLPITCKGDVPRAGQEHVSDGIAGVKDFGFTCNGCHVLKPASGFFGTDGQESFEFLAQIVKIPQLRNMYQKVGMFGAPHMDFVNAGNNGNQGPQVRGFGFLNDGSVDTLFRFFDAEVFNPDPDGTQGFFRGDPQRRDVESFMLAFDSDLPPVVGQQLTLGATRNAALSARLALLLARAAAPYPSKLLGTGARECDVVVKGTVSGIERGWLYEWTTRRFRADRAAEAQRSLAQLVTLADAPQSELTFTCVPSGSGLRVALDRDLDGVLNGDPSP